MLLVLLCLACRNKDSDPDSGIIPEDTGDAPVDADGDGFYEEDDCDDTNSAVYPGASEIPYNGLDDDCDETTPDDDLDGDGFLEADDCDDLDAATNPDATEVCDGLDNDCNGEEDDAVGDLWYADVDRDGFGDASVSSQSCDGANGYVDDATDCDDTDASAYPGAEEVCDEADNDCNGEVDEGVQSIYWADTDGDGHGDPDSSTEGCDLPTGYSDNDNDCDDYDPESTALAEDADCDGTTTDDDCDDEDPDLGQLDEDGDGISSCDGDCDDGDRRTAPGAAEEDSATACMTDADGDGYGSDRPRSGVEAGTDCDDDDDELFPYGDGCGWRAVSCGDDDHNCALKSSGKVHCWGYDGIGSPPSDPVNQLASGGYFDCVLDSSDALDCWGASVGGMESAPSGTYAQVAVGTYANGCVLDDDGDLKCWGVSEYGITYEPSGSFEKVGVGFYFACAIDDDQELVCWGTSDPEPPSGTYQAISVGGGLHACALKTDGAVECFGIGAGIDGAPSSKGWVSIAAGDDHSCAVSGTGTLDCWGDDDYDQVSDAPSGSFTSVCSGDDHSCAITTGGELKCWGDDDYDQVSDTP